MTDQNEAPQAPAAAVEATSGAIPQGDQPPTKTISENPAAATSNGSPHPATEPQEGDHSGDDGDAEGDEVAAVGDAGATPGESGKKKRRRRRRKKPGLLAGTPGSEGSPAGDGAERAERQEKPAKEGPGGVFARFFEGPHGAKRHAFAAGEVVAGRVVRTNDGAFAVDLFGKAMAYVDIFEPREVPAVPEPVAAGSVPSAETAPAVEQAGIPEGTAAPAEGGAAPIGGAAPAEGVPGDFIPGQDSAGGSASADAAPGVFEAPNAPDAAAPVPTLATPEISSEAALPVSATHAEAREHDLTEHADEHHDEASHEEHGAAEPEPEPPPAPSLGEIFRGRIGSVAESGHVAIVNRLIDVPAAKQRLAAARDQRRRVRGVVFGFNRGGFDVLVEGIRVFCPASGMSLGPIENPEDLLGQRLEFTVPPAKAGTHGLVVSRRGIIERQQRKAAKQLLKSLQPGQRLKGRVTQVREFGLFVDLGGIEGLVHQSELSFSRGVRPGDVAKPGDEIEVQVLRVGEGQTRKERERVSLSLKALLDDPWGQHGDLLELGTVHTGKVVRTTEFGAFIELAPQVEGLLHISELGRELKHANQVLNEGDALRVVIERVDRRQRRVSLSRLSQAEEKALEAGTDAKSGRPPKAGQHLTVVVDKVEHAGLIVQVPGVFGRRGRGFIPNSEMGTERGTDHRKGFAPGTQIPVKVIGIDRDGGFRFSRKALLVEEEKRAVQDYRREVARQGLGTFGDLLRRKLEGGKQS